MGSFGESSLAIFIGLFGGSTLLLFLLCLCCQRKLQARTLAMAEITDIESRRTSSAAHHQPGLQNHRRSDAHQLIPALVAPPPDYASVVKKDPSLPSYEAAVSSVSSNGFI